MEATVPNNDGSSSKVTSDSSIDQFPPRGTRQSDRPDREDAIVDSAVEAGNPGNAESTRLADHPATSFDHPISSIEGGEKTDTFDDLYQRNAELVQCYIEEMMAKQQSGGCFGNHWSRRFMNMSTLCRSPQRLKKSKEKEHRCGIKTSSPVQGKNLVPEWKNPILKLRTSTDTSRKQVQILERHRPGKRVSP